MTQDIVEVSTTEENKEQGEKGDSISTNPATKALLFPAVNAVFQPTAEVLGGELKGWVENKIIEKKKARIKKHTEEAKSRSESVGKAELKSERQISNFEIWVENAGDVDPEDPIATAWQSILIDITKDDPETEIILDSLKSLNRAEAAYFVEFVSNNTRRLHPDKNKYYLERLRGKGLINKGVNSIFRDFMYAFYRPLGIDLRKRLGTKHELTWVGIELEKRLDI